MNKQQLAAKIWGSANQMRSKIEANEYKDYILGFIFYKYLSDKELQFAKKEAFTDEEIQLLSEEDNETVEYIKNNIGYFISYNNLFSTWINMGKDFDVSNVRDALSAFSRLIDPAHKKVFEGIFDTLQMGLSKLGENAASQTKAISELIHLIKDIPMDGKQDYDVLGFIYEYLISMFAANAGKKAGEFYTPHEVSLLMSEIVAHHLKDKNEIQIYDPTSGSGSLLINIGHSVSKHMTKKDSVKYFAQELKQNTYNLTRMNLVMRGIKPSNIITRNADTLEDDWPYFDETNPSNAYEPLYVDAVVSNPPYSQNWDSANKETDPRYAEFGIAPKAKADYAFLLHDLYHIKPDGIMTIVLPHGVLFRGNEEAKIRNKLIEKNHIDTIIGLPANIFFGTGIPTVIMILRQKRENTDVLIIDASKGFVKDGKNNKLRASDIKRIADTVINRESIPKYSKVISREKIRENDYNLNIPRYVDSSENTESWDIYASMFGGIPEKEIDELREFWKAFPNLREALFKKKSDSYLELKVKDIGDAISNHIDVKQFVNSFNNSFADFDEFLKKELFTSIESINSSKEESILSEDIFRRLENIPLINKYEAYQLLDDDWNTVDIDLEIIQSEGFDATKKVDPKMVTKKKDGKEQEVQEGWIGRIMPFDLVQEIYLSEDLQNLKKKEKRLLEIATEYQEVIDSLSEEERESKILNDSNDAFVKKEISEAIKVIYADVESEEINILKGYLELLENKAKKIEKESYIKNHTQIEWGEIEANKDGTYGKKAINDYLIKLQSEFTFPEDSYESNIIRVSNLLIEESELKSKVKTEATKLHIKTKESIEKLTDEDVFKLLELKWIYPLISSLNKLPEVVINELIAKIKVLSEKYTVTYESLMNEIHETEKSISDLIDELEGNEYDMKGLSEFKSLLKGE
ncbi:MAG: type I restriction-modification system subunit M [Cetobacterium sp.]|uniref:type I restriction-modification system subunit M n=1 Tax=Cetobacterium sp. TaxID=2071632 RepID=UPI003F2ED0CD